MQHRSCPRIEWQILLAKWLSFVEDVHRPCGPRAAQVGDGRASFYHAHTYWDGVKEARVKDRFWRHMQHELLSKWHFYSTSLSKQYSRALSRHTSDRVEMPFTTLGISTRGYHLQFSSSVCDILTEDNLRSCMRSLCRFQSTSDRWVP